MGEEAGLSLVSGHHGGHPGPVLGEEQPRGRNDPARAGPRKVSAYDANLESVHCTLVAPSLSRIPSWQTRGVGQ